MWNYIQYGEGWLFFAFFYSQNKECSFEAAQTTSCVKKERKIKEKEEIYDATMAAGTGIDPKTLQSIMGHADIQTTMNRYAHRRMDKIEEAKESLKTMYM